MPGPRISSEEAELRRLGALAEGGCTKNKGHRDKNLRGITIRGLQKTQKSEGAYENQANKDRKVLSSK
jgi:hypothetical protein